jgi:hypothetical protein
MDLFQQSGEAMLLAQEGQRQIAHAIAAKVGSWISRFKAWQSAMPITLPPTESHSR